MAEQTEHTWQMLHGGQGAGFVHCCAHCGLRGSREAITRLEALETLAWHLIQEGDEACVIAVLPDDWLICGACRQSLQMTGYQPPFPHLRDCPVLQARALVGEPIVH